MFAESYFIIFWFSFVHSFTRHVILERCEARGYASATLTFSNASRVLSLHRRRPRRHAVHLRASPLQSRQVHAPLIPHLINLTVLCIILLVSLTYETRVTAGRPPSPRGYHVAFLADSRLFVFGGFNGNEVYEDMHLLDLAGAAYLPQVTSFKIDVD